MKIAQNQKGFTILELIIATTVFGVMLILASAGIIQIGRIYYKGITTNRTQEVARSVVEDISRNYQLSGAETFQSKTAGGVVAVCLDTTRYSFKIDETVTDTQHALWVDKIKTYDATCEPLDLTQKTPGDSNTDNSDFGKSMQRELLAKNMRLGHLTISKIDSKDSLTVSVKVIYGDKDLLQEDGTCQPMGFGGQFCAVASLDSFVKGRL